MPKAATSRPELPAQRKRLWLVPISVGALLGLCVPIWLRVTAAGKRSAMVPVPTSENVARSLPAPPVSPALPASPASPAQVPAPAPVVPSAATLHPLGVAKRPEPALDVPVPVAKPDHLGLAREAFNARDWARALDEGKRAVTAGGGAEAHAVVGNTYYKMGRFAEAEQAYTKAVAIEPTNKLLRDRLSIAHVRALEIKKGKEP